MRNVHLLWLQSDVRMFASKARSSTAGTAALVRSGILHICWGCNTTLCPAIELKLSGIAGLIFICRAGRECVATMHRLQPQRMARLILVSLKGTWWHSAGY